MSDRSDSLAYVLMILIYLAGVVTGVIVSWIL